MKSDLFLLLLNIQNRTHWCTFQIFNRDLVTFLKCYHLKEVLNRHIKNFFMIIQHQIEMRVSIENTLCDSPDLIPLVFNSFIYASWQADTVSPIATF